MISKDWTIRAAMAAGVALAVQGCASSPNRMPPAGGYAGPAYAAQPGYAPAPYAAAPAPYAAPAPAPYPTAPYPAAAPFPAAPVVADLPVATTGITGVTERKPDLCKASSYASTATRLDARRIIGLLIGFAGVACLVGLDIEFDDLAAVGAVMLVAVGYAVGPIIINRKLADLPTIGVITASLIVAAVLYAPFSLFVWPAQFTAPAVWSIVGLAVICTALAFLLASLAGAAGT